MTKTNIWIICWLEKSLDGTVKAYRTAVEGKYISGAMTNAKKYITETRNLVDAEYFVTDIGLAEEDSRKLIGTTLPDSIGGDWPE